MSEDRTAVPGAVAAAGVGAPLRQQQSALAAMHRPPPSIAMPRHQAAMLSVPLSFSIPQCQLSHSAVTVRPGAAGYKITPGRPPEARGRKAKACLSGAQRAPAASPKLLN